MATITSTIDTEPTAAIAAILLKRAVADVVRKQPEAGIDMVDDGEYDKTGWIRYVTARMNGFVHREVRPGEKNGRKLNIIGEVEKFSEFYAAYSAIQDYDWMPPGQSRTPLRPEPSATAPKRLARVTKRLSVSRRYAWMRNAACPDLHAERRAASVPAGKDEPAPRASGLVSYLRPRSLRIAAN